MARRRPPFEPGGAGAETGVPANASFAGWTVAAQPERVLAMQAGSNAVAARQPGVPENASFLGKGVAKTNF